MMNIEFGRLIKNPRAKGLMPMVRGWRKALDRFGEFDDQPGYYFNERANIGFLAAGAWFAGWVFLEEYNDHKRRDRKRRVARTDLYINNGDERSTAVVEAKQIWSASTKVPTVQFNKKLCEAQADVKAIRHSDAKLACLFLVPHFSADSHNSYAKSYEDAIRIYIERCTTNLNADLWAWCFPKSNRLHRGTEKQYKGNFYPGVLLAIKGVKYWS